MHPRPLRPAPLLALLTAGALGCAGEAPPDELPAARGQARLDALVLAAGDAPATHAGAAYRVRAAVDQQTLVHTASPGAAIAVHRGVQVDVDASGASLQIASARDALEVRLTRLGAPPRGSSLEGAAVRVDTSDGAYTAWVFAKEHAVEDLLVVRELGAALGYDVELPTGWRLARDSRRVVELVDPLGTPRLRLVAKEAWDARGRALRVGLRLEGPRRVLVDVDATHAELPLYVDPEIQDTGTVAFARSRNNLILGLDGRAYVIGGDAEEPLPVEAFDPRTGRFDVLGPELPARERSAAVVLQDGRIALVGGRRRQAGAWQALDSLDLLDPRTGAITDSFQLADPRAFHTVTRLLDGRLLIAGGERYLADETQPLASSELFDPGQGSLVAGPPLAAPRSALSATRLEDGRVLIAGGGDSAAPGLGVLARKSAELFDPETDSWAPIADDLVAARRLHAATLLHDGRVLLWGGLSTYGGPMPAEVFHPDIESFSATAWSTPALDQPPSQLLPEGALFVSGADLDADSGLTDGSAQGAAYASASTLLHDGTLLYVEGSAAYRGLPDPSVTVNAGWGDALPLRGLHASALLPSGRVLLTGGRYATYEGGGVIALHDQLASVEVDAIDRSALPTAPLARARYHHTSTLLLDGTVLVVGGASSAGADNRVAEIYDPASQSFSDGDALDVDRSEHTATRLASGDVLIVGGSPSTLVERYDSASGSFGYAADLAAPRLRGHSTTVLRDGRVLIAGGGTAQLEIYDPSTGTLELAGTTQRARAGHAAALLPDGRVLLAGGAPTQPPVSFDAELWDPATDTTQLLEVRLGPPWTGAVGRAIPQWNGDVLLDDGVLFRFAAGDFARVYGPSGLYRHGASVTPLPDGSAMVSGYFDGVDTDNAADSYDVVNLHRAHAFRPRVLTFPPSARAGGDVTLGGVRFISPSEATSGHTLASDASPPIAVWLPLGEGTPLLGTLTSFSQQQASWSIPVSPFSGLGSLMVASAGARSDGTAMLLALAETGVPCAADEDCASGVCAAGICCNRACGPCEACTAAEQAGGADGVCGPLPIGSPPREFDACPAEPSSTCGRTGTCDGSGSCATVDEGTPCLEGASCHAGVCVVDPPRCDVSQVVQAGAILDDCEPYACDASATCLSACGSALDCAPEYVCRASGACEPPPAQVSSEPGCSAATTGPRRGALGAGFALALLLVLRARRGREPRALAAALAALTGLSACASRVVEDPPPGPVGQGAGGSAGSGAGATGGAPSEPEARCGNGVREAGELCDGDDLGDISCEQLGLVGGPPRCHHDCTPDPTSCAGCGNGYVDDGEECDGEQLPDQTCLSLADPAWLAHLCGIFEEYCEPSEHVRGDLSCADDCTLDLSGCGYCFDGVISGPEVCDDLDGGGADASPPVLAGETCASQSPYLTGDGLQCGWGCGVFDVSWCERPAPPPCAGGNCSLVLGDGGTPRLPADAALSLDGQGLTIEYWARIDDAGLCALSVANGTFPEGWEHEWGLVHAPGFDSVTFAARRSAPEQPLEALVAYGAVAQGEWFHVAGVIDEPNAELRLYVDGALVADGPLEEALPLSDVLPGVMGVACTHLEAYRTWGRLDEVRVSRGARYDAPFTPEPVHASDSETLALYHLDGADPGLAIDSSGAARHADAGLPLGGEPLQWAGEHP